MQRVDETTATSDILDNSSCSCCSTSSSSSSSTSSSTSSCSCSTTLFPIRALSSSSIENRNPLDESLMPPPPAPTTGYSNKNRSTSSSSVLSDDLDQRLPQYSFFSFGSTVAPLPVRYLTSEELKLKMDARKPNLYLKVDGTGGFGENQGRYYLFVKQHLVSLVPRSAARKNMIALAPFGERLHFLRIPGVSQHHKGVYNYFTRANTHRGWIHLPNLTQRAYILAHSVPTPLHERLYDQLIPVDEDAASATTSALTLTSSSSSAFSFSSAAFLPFTKK